MSRKEFQSGGDESVPRHDHALLQQRAGGVAVAASFASSVSPSSVSSGTLTSGTLTSGTLVSGTMSSGAVTPSAIAPQDVHPASSAVSVPGSDGSGAGAAPDSIYPSRSLPLPNHIAVVMDGNGRWAKERGEPRIHGHRAGARSVRLMVEQCRKWAVRYLTLFSFSTENWNRSADEVKGLMSLFKEYLEGELRDGELLRNGVRLQAIGDRTRLPLPVRQLLAKVERYTEKNDELHLILAVSYGGREDIVNSARRLAELVKKGTIRPDEITVEKMASTLWTAGIPDPDLLIRTGGEMRLSNFLLWQSAYSELVVIPEYWPELTESIFERCLGDYQERERRFGLTSEQLREIEAERTGKRGTKSGPSRPAGKR